MSKLMITLMLIWMSTTALSETRLLIGGWSHHVPTSNSITNESHNTIGIEHNGYSAGRFDNSYDRKTYYLARNWRGPLIEHWNWVGSLGVNRGYRTCYGDNDSEANFCLHGYIGVEYDKYPVVPTLKIVPGALVFSPEIKF